MSDEPRLEQIRTLVEPILAECWLELVELACRPQGRQQVIRLLVDKVGGVTIRECAKANERIGQALEAANLIEESDAIEVSSPGLDRPLAGRRDFERALGEQVVVTVNRPDGRPSDLDGMLLSVQAEAVVLKTVAGNMTIPFSQIQRAKKAIRW